MMHFEAGSAVSESASSHSVSPDKHESRPEANTPVATSVDQDQTTFQERFQCVKEKDVIFIKAVDIRLRLTENAACKPSSSFKVGIGDL